MRLNGKVALVTGGSGNIGNAIVTRLTDEGAAVMIADIDQSAANADADNLRGKGRKAGSIALDVRDEASWANAVAATESEFGSLNIVVNNAGLLSIAPIEEVTGEEIDRIFNVNVRGVFFGVKAGVAAMRRHGQGGSIVNISSLGAMKGEPNLSVYNSSKAASRYLTKCVALECAVRDRNIRLNSVHPGLTIGERPPVHGAETAGEPA